LGAVEAVMVSSCMSKTPRLALEEASNP
jgi:hypothetical protein